METRTLKHTGLTVSRACFGTMTFGSQVDETAAARMVNACLDRGVNFFDTANVYNKGLSETILGNILQCRRDKAVLASKAGLSMGEAPDQHGLSRAALLRAIDDSLRRLRTDYLDIYYLHAPDWSTPIEETLETLDAIVRSGKVRYPAVSNYAGWQAAEMHGLAGKSGYQPPYISQHMYNLLARGVEQEYLAMCRRFGIAAIAYNPLAGGLLTGKQQRQQPIAGTRFDSNQMYLNRYWHPAYFDAVDELSAAAAKSGRSLIDISLNWLLHHTPTDCVILGASKPEQLQQNLDAFEKGPLPEDVLTAIDRVWQNLRGVTPKYNR